jgi:hypothetical protein
VKWLLPLMLVCIALAVLKVMLICLAVSLLLVLAYASLTRPGETLSFIGVATLFTVASAQPLAFIITVGVVCVGVLVAGTWANRRMRLPQTHNQRERLK